MPGQTWWRMNVALVINVRPPRDHSPSSYLWMNTRCSHTTALYSQPRTRLAGCKGQRCLRSFLSETVLLAESVTELVRRDSASPWVVTRKGKGPGKKKLLRDPSPKVKRGACVPALSLLRTPAHILSPRLYRRAQLVSVTLRLPGPISNHSCRNNDTRWKH